jgi:hypothetical protein
LIILLFNHKQKQGRKARREPHFRRKTLRNEPRHISEGRHQKMSQDTFQREDTKKWANTHFRGKTPKKWAKTHFRGKTLRNEPRHISEGRHWKMSLDTFQKEDTKKWA